MSKANKGAKRRMLLLFTIFVVLLTYVCYTGCKYLKQYMANEKEKNKLEDKYSELLADKEILEEDVVKLQDPEYVAKYAREKYLYSKDGELIIKIVEENE